MARATDRLRNLLEHERGESSEEDVEARLDELDDLEAGLDDGIVSDRVETLSLLANEPRYRVVHLLAAAEDDLAICELAPLLDVSYSAVSRALSELAEAELVEQRQDGKWRYYDATDRAERLLAALADAE